MVFTVAGVAVMNAVGALRGDGVGVLGSVARRRYGVESVVVAGILGDAVGVLEAIATRGEGVEWLCCATPVCARWEARERVVE